MKKIFVMLSIFVLLLTSCSLGGPQMNCTTKTDRQIANNTLEQLLDAIQKQDKDIIKYLFSRKVNEEVGELDNDIIDLLNFFQGEIISFDDWAGIGTDSLKEHGKIRTELQSSYSVKTSSREYYIAIKECTVDTFNLNNVGIMSIYIIYAEEWNEAFAYRGDGKWAPGINIETKN